MVANVLLSLENDLTRIGLETIVNKIIIGSKTFNINKSEILETVKIKKIDVLILEAGAFDQDSVHIISEIREMHPHIILFLFLSKSFENYNTSVIKNLSLKYILDTFTIKEINETISNSLNQANSKFLLKHKKNKTSKSISDILSKRELEIARLLINGYKTKEISMAKKISMQATSTYKKRIFEKTQITNVVQLSDLFNNYYIS